MEKKSSVAGGLATDAVCYTNHTRREETTDHDAAPAQRQRPSWSDSPKFRPVCIHWGLAADHDGSGGSPAQTRGPVKSVEVVILSTMLTDRSGVGEWGFSALVGTDGRRILFDTGVRPETVLRNARELKIDLSGVSGTERRVRPTHGYLPPRVSNGIAGSKPPSPVKIPECFVPFPSWRFEPAGVLE